MLREQLEHLLDALPDPTLRQIAEWRWRGPPTPRSPSSSAAPSGTVERKIELIRLIWEKIEAEADLGTPTVETISRLPIDVGSHGGFPEFSPAMSGWRGGREVEG